MHYLDSASFDRDGLLAELCGAHAALGIAECHILSWRTNCPGRHMPFRPRLSSLAPESQYEAGASSRRLVTRGAVLTR